MRAVPRLLHFTVAFTLQLRKITVNLSQGDRNAPCLSIASTFRCRLVRHFACGLDWLADPLACASGSLRRPSASVNICRVAELRDSPHHLTLSRNSRLGGSGVFFKERHPKVLVNLPATDVPRCTTSNAKTLGLENLQLLNVAASCAPPNGSRIVHHWEDELLIQLNSIPDGEAASPVWKTAKHTQLLGGFLPDLYDMRPPAEA
jgi:hypothetical protein